jgi:predicted CoA-binding protein
MDNKKVVILGASNNKERYSYLALKLLDKHNYEVIPVHPTLSEIEGFKVINSITEINEKVGTLTVYVGPARIVPMIDDIVKLNPERVILNPGTESDELKKALKNAGISFIEACTLIMLKTGQFEVEF